MKDLSSSSQLYKSYSDYGNYSFDKLQCQITNEPQTAVQNCGGNYDYYFGTTTKMFYMGKKIETYDYSRFQTVNA